MVAKGNRHQTHNQHIDDVVVLVAYLRRFEYILVYSVYNNITIDGFIFKR